MIDLSPLWLGVLYALLVWWVSTGVILYLDGLPRRTFPVTMGCATLLLAGALWGLAHTRADAGPTGAYCAFSCALLVWAWQELAFLLGIVTGPHRLPCPPQARGWQRTRLALGTVLHHEMALVLLAAAVWLAVGDGANRVGWWTYLALWTMRQSAKLNLFLGARNLSEAFLPEHLKYLHSYFRRRAMNPLFPFSIVATTGMAIWVWQQALALPSSASSLPGLVLVGSLLALGALEHALLVLPLPPEALWRWGMRSRESTAAARSAAADTPARGLALGSDARTDSPAGMANAGPKNARSAAADQPAAGTAPNSPLLRPLVPLAPLRHLPLVPPSSQP